QNGTLTLSPFGIRFSSQVPSFNYDFISSSQKVWAYREKTGYKSQLFIVGGGHCSLALSELMRSMDFYIRVFDDRNNLKTMVENNAAHEKCFINSYSDIAAYIPEGPDHFVVVMTFGYRSDDIAIRSLLSRNYRYLGVLGSQTKIN